MLTIELDNQTEQALQYLAQQQGKTSEQWLKEIIAGEFCRAMRDDEEVNDASSELAKNTSLLTPDLFFASLQEIDTKNPRSLLELIGKGQGCFKNAAEIDAFIRAERDAWED